MSYLPCLRNLVLFVVFFGVFEFAAGEDLFPDKGLEAAVRKEVFAKRYNDEPLTKEDVKNISRVHGRGKGIQDLTGLEHCIAVQEIDLEDNEIEDVSPMAELKLLQSINLAGNKIQSIEPLKDLERVQYLELSRNRVRNIAPLAKMTNMRSLYLSENKVRRLGALKNLTKVWTLYVAKNPIKDFAPVGKLKWLSSFDASQCNLEKLDFLKPLTELKYVNVSENKLKDVSVLLEMARADEERRFSPFWKLYLKGNPLEEKTAEEQLEQLTKMGARISME